MPHMQMDRTRGHVLLRMVAAALAFGSPGGAGAQYAGGGLDLDAPPAADRPGGLDMDVDPSAPLAPAPAANPVPHESSPDAAGSVPPQADQPPPAAAGDAASPIVGSSDVLALSWPLTLFHPKVLTTAQLQADETTVTLFGIEGEAGDDVQGLQAFLSAAADDRVTCQAQGNAGFVCLMADGTDVAQVALVNGVARTKPDAPDSYREQEAAAQTARRGIWVNLPPPPETVQHPIVRDTATLQAGNRTYTLGGLIGFSAPYSSQLQGYILAKGDSMTCSRQGDTGHFVCLLPDGTDIAKVTLVNGAARVTEDAPDDYRAQQLDALNNRRGYWLTAPDAAITAALLPPQPEYVLAAGDDGQDGITYAGGAPMALIDGAPVFLAFGAGLGWGYYDHYRHWRGAPERYRAHLEYFHPEGRGLRGFAYRSDAGLRPVEVMHEGAHSGPGGFAPPGHPGTAGHPGAAANPDMPAAHPGPVPIGGHPGGFVRPGVTASAGGTHSGAPVPPMHSAAAPRVSAAAASRHK